MARYCFFFFSSRRRHTRLQGDWSSDVCSSDLLDARRGPGQPSGFEVTTHGGRRGTGLDAIEWARRATAAGAGEVLLNSMDADGRQEGFDLAMIAAVRAAVTVPVIASGGAGEVAHFAP